MIKFNDLIEAFENAGMQTQRYSGRAMFGKQCLGVQCGNPTTAILEALECHITTITGDKHAVIDGVTEFCRLLKDPRVDQLGYNKIVYWPSVEWELGQGEEEELEEDDEETVVGLSSKTVASLREAHEQGLTIERRTTLPSAADMSGVPNKGKKS
jgi:hypothetical protein